jgi:hypothetical protein
MLRTVLRLQDGSNVDELMETVRAQIALANLGDEGVELQQHIESMLRDFASNGSKLAKSGSQFSAERTLAGPQHEIKIVAQYGARPSVLSRLGRLLRHA